MLPANLEGKPTVFLAPQFPAWHRRQAILIPSISAKPRPKKSMTYESSNTDASTSMPVARRTLYPSIEPYFVSRLKVSEIHTVYYELSGNPDGLPVCFVHGGPGGGTEPAHRRFFDPNGTTRSILPLSHILLAR